MHDWEDVESWACAILTFEDGSRATCLAADTVLGGMDDTVHLYLPNARINCNFTHSTALQVYAPETAVFPGEPLQEKLSTNAGWSYPPLDMEYMLGYAAEIQEFVGAVATGSAPLSDGALGRAVVEAIYAAYLSAAEGRRIDVDLPDPELDPDPIVHNAPRVHAASTREKGRDRATRESTPSACAGRAGTPSRCSTTPPGWASTWCSSPPARTSPPTIPGYLREVRAHADRLGLQVELGMGSIDRYAASFRPQLGSGAEQLADMCRAARARLALRPLLPRHAGRSPRRRPLPRARRRMRRTRSRPSPPGPRPRAEDRRREPRLRRFPGR